MLRFLSFLVGIAIIALIVVAFVRGWVDISSFNKEDASESGATLTIHKNKVKDDIAAAKEKVHLPTKHSDNKQETKVHGKVQEVGAADLILTTDKDKSLKVDVAPETDIRVGDHQGKLSDLKQGDEVTARYVTLEDRHVAVSVQKD